MLCFIISLSANAAKIDCNVFYNAQTEIVDTITVPDEELSVKPTSSETEFVATNSVNHELSATNDRRNNFTNGNIDKTSPQSRLLQQIFTSKYNKTFYSTSHKISSYLKNEICTRAP